MFCGHVNRKAQWKEMEIKWPNYSVVKYVRLALEHRWYPKCKNMLENIKLTNNWLVACRNLS